MVLILSVFIAMPSHGRHSGGAYSSSILLAGLRVGNLGQSLILSTSCIPSVLVLFCSTLDASPPSSESIFSSAPICVPASLSPFPLPLCCWEAFLASGRENIPLRRS